MKISRRELIQLTGMGSAGFLLSDAVSPSPVSASSESEKEEIQYQTLNRFPRMVQEHFVRRVREQERLNPLAQDQLRTREDAEKYVRSVREKIKASFGPFPEKTPLNPRITNTVERDTYRIENIIFESRPNFLVTGNLYIPKERNFPLPGVIGVCGHSATGKAVDTYQAFTQGLARQGYVVFIIDPLGQGERLQYPDENLKSKVGVGVREHLFAGNQQFLTGEFIGTWRAWDAVRALDYLLTREEVDPRHIGLTGNSGGGTLTTWLCGLDDRWTMAAPSCFVTTFRRNLENELPADTEQCPPRALALGLDHADFIAAMAPRPVILLGKERDYFDARGLEEAYQRLRRLYALLGAEDNISLFIGPTYHGFTQENREAMYRWFNKITGISDLESEPEIEYEKDETLWCTPNGQVSELGSRTVFSFTQEKSRALAAKRSSLNGDALKREVYDVLKLPERNGVPDYRIQRKISTRGYPKPHFLTYMVETEPDIHAFVYLLTEETLLSRLPGDRDQAILYVSHRSSDVELREEPLIRDLIESEPESALFTCDVRGIGESQPNTCGTSFTNPYGSDYFYAIHSLMLDYPYVGQRTYDILRVVDWLSGHGYTNIHLAATGWGAIPATFAGLFSDSVKRITLKNALKSFSDIAETEDYRWPLSSLLPNVLERFDLPDCYRELERKQLRMIEPWGAGL